MKRSFALLNFIFIYVSTLFAQQTSGNVDSGFATTSEILLTTVSENQKEDLALVGQMWGFLKYYHPSIAKGKYNWDYELFRILPKVLETKNRTERNNVLLAWVEKFGKVNAGRGSNFDNEKIKLKPNWDWINEAGLGVDLYNKLTVIKNANRPDKGFYVEMASGVGNPVFKNENSYSEMKYPDTGYRLLSLYRYWNIIQYFFPNRHLIEEDWNGVLKEFVPKFIEASNELNYKLTVLSLIERIHDTHANIWQNDTVLNTYKGLKYAPLKVRFIENKAIVTGYIDTVLGKRTGLKRGDIIESVDSKPIEEIIKERLKSTPASNYPTKLRDIAYNLLRTNSSSIDICYKRGDTIVETKIASYSPEELDFYKQWKTRDTCYKKLQDDVAYLYPATIKNKYLPVIMPEVLKTKGLIIDFRRYPSDFLVFTLCPYLLPKSTNFVKISKGNASTPGLFTVNTTLRTGRTNSNYYKGKVIILVNENTQSSAEYQTMALRTAPQATVLGSTTAGADGNISPFYLPGGIYTMISGIGILTPDGNETQRIGIVPDIEFKPTINGIKEGKDELLEKAIELINKG